MKKINIPEKELRMLYLDKRLSTYKIGRIFSCDPSVIQKRLREYDIPLRYPKARIDISKRTLDELYTNQKLSTYKIARLLGIASVTVYYKLKEHGIRTRPKKVISINRDFLERLYNEEKMPLSEIGKIYGTSSAVILKRMRMLGIDTRSLSEACTLYNKKRFDGSDVLRAYMIGFSIGDLNVKKPCKNSGYIQIKTNTTIPEQFEMIRDVFGSYGHFYHCGESSSHFSITCNLDKSFRFLLHDKKDINKWILKNKKNFYSFLAGYTDAEGCIKIYNKRARYRIGSYDRNILFQIHGKLIENGIDSKFRLETQKGIYNKRRHNGDFYRVSVNRKSDLLKLLMNIKPFMRHKNKYKDLINAENNIRERIKRFGE